MAGEIGGDEVGVFEVGEAGGALFFPGAETVEEEEGFRGGEAASGVGEEHDLRGLVEVFFNREIHETWLRGDLIWCMSCSVCGDLYGSDHCEHEREGQVQ